MSKENLSTLVLQFMEERERAHLDYLRETKRAYMEKDRAARDRDAGAVGYDFSAGTYIHSTHGSAATYPLVEPTTHAADTLRYVWGSGPSTAAPVPPEAKEGGTGFRYLTLEEAMRLHREEEARKYYTAKPGYPSTWVVETSPVIQVQKSIRVAGLSDGTYPEVGMRVMHDGVTFEIERIEIETPSWRPIAVGHAVGDTDTFTAGRLYVRAPLDELQPAKAKENVA